MTKSDSGIVYLFPCETILLFEKLKAGWVKVGKGEEIRASRDYLVVRAWIAGIDVNYPFNIHSASVNHTHIFQDK